MKANKFVALLLAGLLAAGCSSKGEKKAEKPVALEKISAEVKLHKEWSTSVGVGQGKLWNRLTPAIDGGQLFVADAGGLVLSLDRYTGKKNWQRKLKKTEISGAIGAGAGQVVLGTLAGEVIALDAATGNDLWRVRIGSEILAAPAVNDRVVVVQTQDDRLIALDAFTGAQRWVHESTPALLTLRGTSAPLLTDYVVYAGLSTGKVIAVELEHGLPVWEQRIAVPSGRTELERMVDVDGSLVLKDGVLYVSAFNGHAAGLDEQTGRVLWQRASSSTGAVAQGYGNAYVSLDGGTIEAVDERSGSVMWRNESLLRREPTGLGTLSSYVVTGDLEGYVHLLSQVDGRFVARTRIDSKGIRVRPLVEGGWMYVYGNGGKLVALTIQ
ncbi:Beta-barrel assembly machine subunit BamB [Thiopseudomonas denitrificans]|uniref:Outer membrane protein assembly factor BamB n=2 Tax=Thiopseudomonas denitrificans TaxID=1501432 RepID=A0A4R6U607_9GAMM|nr:Beta-barrel assembly machine subunit BamB [Thiopseudomonas denitrificans]